MESVQVSPHVGLSVGRSEIKGGTVRGLKCPKCRRRYETASDMLFHLKSHFDVIRKGCGDAAKQKQHDRANNKERNIMLESAKKMCTMFAPTAIYKETKINSSTSKIKVKIGKNTFKRAGHGPFAVHNSDFKSYRSGPMISLRDSIEDTVSRSETSSVMPAHFKKSHSINKDIGEATKLKKQHDGAKKKKIKPITKRARQLPANTPKRSPLVVAFDALEEQVRRSELGTKSPMTKTQRYLRITNSREIKKLKSIGGTRMRAQPNSAQTPLNVGLDEARFENDEGKISTNIIVDSKSPACNKIRDHANMSEKDRHTFRALYIKTDCEAPPKVEPTALHEKITTSQVNTRSPSRVNAMESHTQVNSKREKLPRFNFKISKNNFRGRPGPFAVRNYGFKGDSSGSIMPLHDSKEDTQSRNDREWKCLPSFSLKTTFLITSILLLLYAGVCTLALVATIGQHRAQANEGYDFQILIYYTYLFGQEALLFILYLRTIKPSLVHRQNLRTWSGIIAVMCFFRVLTEWRVVRSNIPLAVVGIFACFYGLANMVCTLFYPLYLLSDAGLLGDEKRGKARCWQVLSITRHPTMVLFYIPLMLVTFCLPLVFPFDQAIFTLLLAVWSVFGVIALLCMAALKEYFRHDYIGYVLYCAVTSYSPRVVGNVISALTRLKFAYRGAMLVVATKVIFQLGMFMLSVQLKVLASHGARGTNALLFAWQIGQYFIINALFLDAGFDAEFLVMYIVNMGSSIFRDSGMLHEFFCKYIMKMTNSIDIANEMKEQYTLTQQNSLATVLCAPLLLVMVMVEYAATMGEKPLGIPLIMATVDRSNIRDVLLVFVIMVPTNSLIAWAGHHLFTKRMSRLERKSILDRLGSPWTLTKSSSLVPLQLDFAKSEEGGVANGAVGNTPKSHQGGVQEDPSNPSVPGENRSSFSPPALGSMKGEMFAMYSNADERGKDEKSKQNMQNVSSRRDERQRSTVSQTSTTKPSIPIRGVRPSQESSRHSTSRSETRSSNRSSSAGTSVAMSLPRVLGGSDIKIRKENSDSSTPSRTSWLGKKPRRMHTRTTIFAKKRVKREVRDLWRNNGLLFFFVVCVMVNSTRHWTLLH